MITVLLLTTKDNIYTQMSSEQLGDFATQLQENKTGAVTVELASGETHFAVGFIVYGKAIHHYPKIITTGGL